MKRTVTIADAHSANNPTQKLTIPLSGGSPWFGAVWINDVCYVVEIDGVTGKLSIKLEYETEYFWRIGVDPATLCPCATTQIPKARGKEEAP